MYVFVIRPWNLLQRPLKNVNLKTGGGKYNWPKVIIGGCVRSGPFSRPGGG